MEGGDSFLLACFVVILVVILVVIFVAIFVVILVVIFVIIFVVIAQRPDARQHDSVRGALLQQRPLQFDAGATARQKDQPFGQRYLPALRLRQDAASQRLDEGVARGNAVELAANSRRRRSAHGDAFNPLHARRACNKALGSPTCSHRPRHTLSSASPNSLPAAASCA